MFISWTRCWKAVQYVLYVCPGSLMMEIKPALPSLNSVYDPDEWSQHIKLHLMDLLSRSNLKNNMVTRFENQTTMHEFLLLAFNIKSGRVLLFSFLLLVYLVTLIGNLLIIAATYFDVNLHSPMYYFLSNLSLSEIVFTTNIMPNLLNTTLHGERMMSQGSCIVQYYMFSSSTTAECLLLTVMSYDRYLAICNPFHYSSMMTLWICLQLVLWSWIAGFMLSIIEALLLSQMSYCGSTVIDHFFCDLVPLMQLSCSDTYAIEMTDFVLSFPILVCPIIFIIVSYAKIISTILRIPSVTGRKKAFSTCSSHLIVVCTYYGTCIFIYMTPAMEDSFTLKKVLSLLYIMVTPLINPFIYSLRNKDISMSFIKLSKRLKGL
uniref:Olfactory receptor n=1 Tax=Leptobrachium leishanense TaxID=445787 RepID=A0A8C5M3A3_9ANUR